MKQENAIRRAQIYGYLAETFLYPRDNWTEDGPLAAAIVRSLGWPAAVPEIPPVSLAALQAAYRQTFGAAGSLAYETEYGLPHEYRQSQEMADIAGFYRAFGFHVGGKVRERADHVAVELEFMHALALKEAVALDQGTAEQTEICIDGQRQFLGDHLGHWIDLFAQSVVHNAPDSLYGPLARFAAAFVAADAERLGVALERAEVGEIQHTPFDPDFSCAGCAPAGMGEAGLIRLDTIT